jgi:hypothetical protein
MSKIVYAEYRKLRDQGVPARFAVDALRRNRPDFTDEDGQLVYTEHGFRVVISAEPDTEPLETGHFMDLPAPGALDLGKRRMDGGGFRFFLPDITADEHFEAQQQMGRSKQVARETALSYVWTDLRVALGLDYPAYVVVVSVRLEGVELGSSALGSARFDKGGIRHPEDLLDFAIQHGMVADAISDARARLVTLRKAMEAL